MQRRRNPPVESDPYTRRLLSLRRTLRAFTIGAVAITAGFGLILWLLTTSFIIAIVTPLTVFGWLPYLLVREIHRVIRIEAFFQESDRERVAINARREPNIKFEV